MSMISFWFAGDSAGRARLTATTLCFLIVRKCGAFLLPPPRPSLLHDSVAPVLYRTESDATVVAMPTAPTEQKKYSSYSPAQMLEAQRAAEANGRRLHDPFAMNALFVNVEERPDPLPCAISADSPTSELPLDLPPGCLLRVGPNGASADEGFMDGDGLVHAVTLPPPGSNREIMYSSTYIDTKARLLERKSGWGTTFAGTLGAAPEGFPMLANLLRNGMTFGTLQAQKDTCNSALAVSGDRVLALMEASPPSEIKLSREGRMRTVEGSARLDGAVPNAPISGGSLGAHGRTDPATGERVHVSYRSNSRPYLRVDTFSEGWKLESTVGVDVPSPVIVHDCALTPRYVVILDFPLTIRPERMLLQNKFPVEYEPRNGARIGLTPRGRARDETVWFDVEDGMVLHAADAYEREDGAVVIHAFKCEPDPSSSYMLDYVPAFLYEWILDPAAGEVVGERCLNPDVTVEFPACPPTGEGARTAYGLVTTGIGGPLLRFKTPRSAATADAVARFALEDDAARGFVAGDVAGRHDLPAGWHCVSEPTIVEKTAGDGHYVLLVATFVPPRGEFDYEADPCVVAKSGESMKSQLLILDGDRLSNGPVTRVDLPHYVNFGLHSTFIDWDILEY